MVLRSPMAATVVQLHVAAGEQVRTGQPLIVLDAMKMEHELRAEHDAKVTAIHVAAGDTVADGASLLDLVALPTSASVHAIAPPRAPLDDGGLRADLRESIERHALTLDASRPDAVARRHAAGQRTARENIDDLCDAGSFVEYGALAVAARRSRRSLDDLMRNTPADGMVTGIGSVNREQFGDERSRCVVMAYDATVLAGTQGMWNRAKTDRLLGIALEQRLPVLLFAEGGGGRPGDTDANVVAGLNVTTFSSLARLSGVVPTIGIAAGRCFAGKAALLGCCDVVIATEGSNIGMGGPAMIEGGGLGRFSPEQIGPSDTQSRNGVIDVLVADERAAAAAARSVLSHFQGRLDDWHAPDTAALRNALPENRARVYDIRGLLASLVDADSLLELRRRYGGAVLTALARIEGRSVALLASDPAVLGGAIDADAADKAARFIDLADAHALPIVSLIDTPGFLVGPDAEAGALVRRTGRLFVAGARRRVPLFAVVLRKAYGLGAMALAGGGLHAAVGAVAWPSGEFGAMGLEGAVRLGFRRELHAVPEGPEREALFERLLQRQVDAGRAINVASVLEIDAVIDPATTRAWLARGLAAAKAGVPT